MRCRFQNTEVFGTGSETVEKNCRKVYSSVWLKKVLPFWIFSILT